MAKFKHFKPQFMFSFYKNYCKALSTHAISVILSSSRYLEFFFIFFQNYLEWFEACDIQWLECMQSMSR
jgi:hypothetical protein